MAQKRMFSLHIVDSDAFLDMPASTQLLYFHLCMRADDEGFVGNPKRIMRLIGASDDDYKILIAKRFVLVFESAVMVIKHWLIHNTIRMDRFNSTTYQDEKKLLEIKDNKAYTLGGNDMETIGLPSGNQMETQVKLSKVKLSKVSEDIVVDEMSEKKEYGQFKRVKLTGYEYESLQQSLGDMPLKSLITELDEYIESIGKDKYRNHRATIQTWARRKINSFAEKKMSAKPKVL